MKKAHLFRFLATVLALSTVLSPLNVQAATPLTDKNFNAKRYAKDNPDLQAVYGNDAASLWAHYVNFGSKENRKAYATNGDIGYLKQVTPAAANQPLSVNTFNYKGYADKYPDLKAVFGYNQQALYDHYTTLGIAEGRTLPGETAPSKKPAQQAAPAQASNIDINSFDFKGYADKYPDLKAVFGYNQQALYNHYVTLGKAEGRTLPKAGTTPAAAQPAASQVPSDFNYKAYADKYPDLKAAFGYNQQALYNHYITRGKAEGRTPTPGKTTAQNAPAPATAGGVFASVVPNTISVLGDSISTFNGFNHGGYALYYPKDNVKDVGQMWWAQAAAARGLSVLSNCSWSGSAVVGEPNKQNASAGCSWRRITDIAVNGQAPAIILIMMGTNDYNFNSKIGPHKVGDPGASTWDFGGAYDIMLTKMKAAYPNTRIICLTIPPVWGSNGQEPNGAGHGIPAYNAKIREIAAGHGLQVIDTYSVFHGGDTIEGMHPNAKGMQEIAVAVAAGL